MSQSLIPTIDSLIQKLSMPLQPDELAHGWSESSQEAMLKFFEDLRLKVIADADLPYLGIVRALDHWGVSGGELFREAAQIDHELRREPR